MESSVSREVTAFRPRDDAIFGEPLAVGEEIQIRKAPGRRFGCAGRERKPA